MKLSKLVFIGVASLALPAISGAQIKKVGPGYLFRVKFTQGKVLKYGISSNVNMPSAGRTFAVSGPFSLKVLSINGDTATLQATIGPLSANGRAMNKPQIMTIKENTRGKVVGGGASSMQQMSIALPEKPVSPGSTWTGETSVAGGMGPTHVSAKYKFVGIKNSGGHQMAQLAITVSSSGSATTSGTGTVFLLMEDGSLWSSTTNMSISGAQTGGNAMKMNIVVTRK
jgi:hypothetical protein